MKPALGFVSVIGMGYVGLRTSAAFASKGIRTVGIDIDEKRIEQIQQGRAPLHEPQLDRMLKKSGKKETPHRNERYFSNHPHIFDLSNRRNAQPGRRLHRPHQYGKSHGGIGHGAS